jgi:hypothetical protein
MISAVIQTEDRRGPEPVQWTFVGQVDADWLIWV